MDKLLKSYFHWFWLIDLLVLVFSIGTIWFCWQLGSPLMSIKEEAKISANHYLFNGILFFGVLLLLGFLAFLLFQYSKRRLELAQTRWQEIYARTEREELRNSKPSQAIPNLEKIKEKYKTIKDLFPEDKEDKVNNALEVLKQKLNRQLLPQLSAVSGDDQEKFKAFKAQFQLLDELKPDEKTDDKIYKEHHQTVETMLKSQFNDFAIQWLGKQ